MNQYRNTCYSCFRPSWECYCAEINSFHSRPQFVFLTHPKEFRKAINTGKMAHQCLENSKLFVGTDFSEHQGLQEIIDRGKTYILFPGAESQTLAHDCQEKFRDASFIVLDGTWSTAKRIFKLSKNLHHLPQVSFSEEFISQYSIRKQPKPGCLSSIETVVKVLEILESGKPEDRRGLLNIFQSMVKKQIDYERNAGSQP